MKETVQPPPVAAKWWLDAISGEAIQGSSAALEPIDARTLLLP